MIHTRRFFRVAGISGALLLVPLVATLTTDAVAWGPADFVLAGVVLLLGGWACEVMAARVHDHRYLLAGVMAVATMLAQIVANLAVGIIGVEGSLINQLFFAVPVIGVAGAALVRLRPGPMSWILFAVAVAQSLVPLVGEAAWPDEAAATGRELVFNGVFVLLFVVSGVLFRRSALVANDPGSGQE